MWPAISATTVLWALIYCTIFLVLLWGVGVIWFRRKRPSQFTVGFFHPYCNDGGGGERVLWCAVEALQREYTSLNIIVFTGQEAGVTPEKILENAKVRFGVTLLRPVEFIFLTKRHLIEASRYPRFTMLMQSLASAVLGWEALSKYNPHVFVDTMGYAFTYPVFLLLGRCSMAAYVHYPTISTDMIDTVQQRVARFNNQGDVARSNTLSLGKYYYYIAFAKLYGWMGSCCSVVMVNSKWTRNHIDYIWGHAERTTIVYPPCDTSNLQRMDLDAPREPIILSVGQFRPEKNHLLQLQFFKALKARAQCPAGARLVVAGATRIQDDRDRVDALIEEAQKLGLSVKEIKHDHGVKLPQPVPLTTDVTFAVNFPYKDLTALLGRACIGLHTMTQEHFGISIVEFMAAGAVALANDSGGPREDIIVEEATTGFRAITADEYADKAVQLFGPGGEARRHAMAAAGRASVATRFSEATFHRAWLACLAPLLRVPTNR